MLRSFCPLEFQLLVAFNWQNCSNASKPGQNCAICMEEGGDGVVGSEKIGLTGRNRILFATKLIEKCDGVTQQYTTRPHKKSKFVSQ